MAAAANLAGTPCPFKASSTFLLQHRRCRPINVAYPLARTAVTRRVTQPHHAGMIAMTWFDTFLAILKDNDIRLVSSCP